MGIDVSKLQVTLEEGERGQRTLKITVPADLMAEERRAAAQKLSKRLDLPGFRKGKVPMAVVEQRFGPALQQELVDRVVGDAYREVLRDRNIRPISQGEVDDVDYAPDADLNFSVNFEVSPDIELARLGGFQVKRPHYPVTDTEVDKVLDQLRERQGTWAPREEGKPGEGDMVAVRIQRLSEEDDEPRPYELTLGKDEAIPEVEEAIRSLEVGEQGDFTVAFPEDFPNEERRGDTEELRIFLDSRKELEVPELDDDFAQSAGEFETLDELKEQIEADLKKEATEQAEAAVRGQLLEQLLAANPFDVPQAMIDEYLRSVMTEDGEEPSDDQIARARDEVGDRAERAVKRVLAIQAVARSKELKATQDEVDERIEKIAESNDASPGEIYARLQKAGQIERLEREITERKVFEFLKSESTITDEN